MKNIFLVLQREYLTRVRKKSFIVMTLLAPLLMLGFSLSVGYLSASSIELKKVQILDDSGLFINKFPNSKEVQFSYTSDKLEEAKTRLKKSDITALTYIPKDIMQNPKGLKIFAEKGVPLELQMKIEGSVEREIERIKLTEAGITQKVLEDAKMNVSSETFSLDEKGEKISSSAAATGIGYFCAFLIYISVIVYGAQVMRGVMEEKTSRIVEVIISSIKPFELMMGKIIGVALVGLTQFLLWIVLSLGVLTVTGTLLKDKAPASQSMTMSPAQMQNMPPEMRAQMKKQGTTTNMMSNVIQALETLPVAQIIFCFFFYFIGGYLLYSALFGAVGSAVDNDTDTQQFMLPLTMPIIISIFIAQLAMRDPEGKIAFWGSMVPFSSPIVMMARIPFGVPIWQLALSMILLVAGFIFTTWLAARIYRIGILMYGKKVNFKELAKWVFYKG